MIKDIAKITVAAALIAAAPLAFAQTTTGSGSTGTTYTTTSAGRTTGTTGTTGSTSPGVPNTGAGGEATTNALVLALTGAIALGGVGYLATRRNVRA